MALAFAIAQVQGSICHIDPPKLGICCMASCMAMQEKALHVHASSPQAPYVSTASGMHCQPSYEHFGHFVDSAAYIIISHTEYGLLP